MVSPKGFYRIEVSPEGYYFFDNIIISYYGNGCNIQNVQKSAIKIVQLAGLPKMRLAAADSQPHKKQAI